MNSGNDAIGRPLTAREERFAWPGCDKRVPPAIAYLQRLAVRQLVRVGRGAVRAAQELFA